MSSKQTGCNQCSCYDLSRYACDAAGRLFLWFPVAHTLSKATNRLDSLSLSYELMQGRSGLSVDCDAGQAKEIADGLSQTLGSREMEETQVLFIRGNIQPKLEDFSDIAPLKKFLNRTQSDWLVDMMKVNRFTSYFQPIVSIQNTSEIFAYEALLRGVSPDGKVVFPKEIIDTATGSGLLPQMDRMARLSAIAQFSLHKAKQKIFINFAPTALYDPVFCLNTTVQAIDRAGIAHDQVVFEVVESDEFKDSSHLKAIINHYRKSGFLIALDDLGEGYSSLNLLHQVRPDFVKLDMALIRDVHRDPYKASITEKILEIAQNLNVKTVAEGIECVEELNWLQERGATFAQGFLIGKPSPTPVQETPYFETSLSIAAQRQNKIRLQKSKFEGIISETTQRIRHSLELDDILQTTVAEVRKLFEVDRVCVYQFKPDWSGIIAVESVAQGCFSLAHTDGIEQHFQSSHWSLAENHQTRALFDIETSDLAPHHLEQLRAWKIRASLMVPILQQGNLWGLLLAHQCNAPRFWQDLEIDLFGRLAEQAAIVIQQSELYDQLQKSNQELQRLAISDGLTQVANRRHFDSMLKQEWQKLEDKTAPLSLLLCDVDFFKIYNNTYGHSAGDEVLKQIAREIKQAVSAENALVARYSGGEFAVILPNVNLDDAVETAQKIQVKIAALQLPHCTSTVSPFITLSIGIAAHIPDVQISPEVLISEADKHLSQAKIQGGNAWSIGSEN